METIKFDKLNVEIEVKTDEVSLFEIKELRDRIRVFFEDKKILVIHRNSRVRLCNFAHVICYTGRVVVFNNACVEARGFQSPR